MGPVQLQNRQLRSDVLQNPCGAAPAERLQGAEGTTWRLEEAAESGVRKKKELVRT